MAELSQREQYWCDRQPWLLSLGYQLRPRFRPGWVPSWFTHPADIFELNRREDYIHHRGVAPIMDAIRLHDNLPVMMKKIWSREREVDDEQNICEYVSSDEQLQDPDNHCVPIIDILPLPEDNDHVILVMPLLREWKSPRFDTVGEVLDMIHQAFKGIQYLHRNGIAHCDCNEMNLMMDGSEMYPEGFHPARHDHNREFTGPAIQRYTRTQRPPNYYWIDFGLSLRFDPSNHSPRAIPMHGGDKSPPEHQHIYKSQGPRQPTDPFATDIYYLGNLIREFFTEGSVKLRLPGCYGFTFLEPLVEVMIQDDPAKRPTINQCVIHLEGIIRSQSSWTLRSQVWHRSDNIFGFLYRFFPHWARRVVYIITRTQAIPSRDRPPSHYLRLYAHVLLVLWVIIPLVFRYWSSTSLQALLGFLLA